jgi:hypothetical protein
MTSRTCEEYRGQENGKEDRQENEVRRRKKNFQREVVEENAPEENGISNRLSSSTFIPPLTMAKALTVYGADTLETKDGRHIKWRELLALRLINLQHSDGSWANDKGR